MPTFNQYKYMVKCGRLDFLQCYCGKVRDTLDQMRNDLTPREFDEILDEICFSCEIKESKPTPTPITGSGGGTTVVVVEPVDPQPEIEPPQAEACAEFPTLPEIDGFSI